MKDKKTHTRGIFRDQAAFDRITHEFEIPPEVAVKGMDAIIQWINDSKGPIKKAAALAAVFALFAGVTNKAEPNRVGIAGDARIQYKESSFAGWLRSITGDGFYTYQGAVVQDSLNVRATDGSRDKSVDCETIAKIVRIDKHLHLITYLDGQRESATIMTDPILFQTNEYRSILGSSPSEIKRLRPSRIVGIHAASGGRTSSKHSVDSSRSYPDLLPQNKR